MVSIGKTGCVYLAIPPAKLVFLEVRIVAFRATQMPTSIALIMSVFDAHRKTTALLVIKTLQIHAQAVHMVSTCQTVIARIDVSRIV